ncbi:CAF1-domain-containing protein [Patellaria atrata CBS 101060]|uniref:CAF1-domain-containing protein n=1 Tax=Patellaria atrata CBS 101060 TaxID=1346257 RepID=A0A9P4VKF2_9PEZI|nr:CAF1-domain-containing protein [Patellaria atrata CBS 101060]
MDVTRISFPARLLEVLEALSESTFVALDLELSGIPVQKPRNAQKQTMEERYQEVKAAAERFQILQIGLTCVFEDLQENKYTLKPYNFNLCPILDEKLDIEREFSYSSGAVEFLLSHGFHMELPFTMGVPYLSREEAKLAKLLAYERFDSSSYETITIDPSDIHSLAFINQLREDIQSWEKTGKPYPDCLWIPTRRAEDIGEPRSLSRYERRLVHQTIRSEYPDYVTLTRKDSIKIIFYDQVREEEVLKSKKRRVKEQISRQVGFRWIVDAMTGEDISNIDVQSFAKHPDTGHDRCVDLDELRSRFNYARENLKNRRPVLVGHNMFTDMVYFYKCFIGALPPTLRDFEIALNESFPKIVDTKYLSTHMSGHLNSTFTLEQLEKDLREQETPLYRVHPKFTKYTEGGFAHEAGYDSYLTAVVAILLSAKLEASGSWVDPQDHILSDDEAYETAPEDSSRISLDGHVLSTVDPVVESTEHSSPETPSTTGTVTMSPREPMILMPHFATDFWRVYGNKLRVFGTVEGISVLPSWKVGK